MQRLPTDRTRPPTIREVAQRAGVSHQTVARYIKSHGVGIKPATIEKVSAAIEELGYRPNLVARAMRARHTDAVAIVLPQGTAISSLEVLAGATQLTDEAGLRLEVVFVGGDVDARTDRVVEMSRSGLFDGILSLVDLDEAHLSGGCSVVTMPLYDEHMRGQGALADASCVRTLMQR
ncbi:LacI family DNA-binding transcriptional regulator, partial [Pseudactinotalea sp.]|uniref:LacI family DNA-binding transcriptional regulator n=1 Tax=Pseudactinotalea sp. TaxID=1926260 RepID=UPI003B3B2FF6